MKKNILYTLAIAGLMASCNNAGSKMDEQPAAGGSTTGMKIAYVEVDSLMTQYDFAKDYSVTLEKKSNNARNTLTQKGNALQAAIERQKRDLQELQARLENELASETAKFNVALRDSLQNFLKAYNKDKHFDLILSKAGDNLLWADKKFDITNDVINGLNKRYKPGKKTEAAEETKKEEKK